MSMSETLTATRSAPLGVTAKDIAHSAFTREPAETSQPTGQTTKIIAKTGNPSANPADTILSTAHMPSLSSTRTSGAPDDLPNQTTTADSSRITLKLRIPARRKLEDSGSTSNEPPTKDANTKPGGSAASAVPPRASVEVDLDDDSMDGTTIVDEGSIRGKGGGVKIATSVHEDPVGEELDSGDRSTLGDSKGTALVDFSESDLTSLESSDGESEIDSPDSDHEEPTIQVPEWEGNRTQPLTKTKTKDKAARNANGRICLSATCNNELPVGFRYKYCLSCRPKLPEQLKGTLPKAPSYAVDPSVPRPCVIVSCRRPIPPLEVYRWKLCYECRERTKLQARARKQALVDSVLAAAGSSGAPLKQCANNRCRAGIPMDRDDVLCEGCRQNCDTVQDSVVAILQAKRGVKRPSQDAPSPSAAKKPRSSSNPSQNSGSARGPSRWPGLPQPILLPAELDLAVKTAPAPPAPPVRTASHTLSESTSHSGTVQASTKKYQHIAEVMLSLQEAVRTFVRTRAHEIDHIPVTFDFRGEFSVVSGQRNNEQALCLSAVCRELEKALSVKLYAVNSSEIDGTGVRSQYDCLQRIEFSITPSSVPGGAAPSSSTPQRQYIRLAGDIDIAIVGDGRHRFFPGHRVSIRVTFVG